MSLYHLQFSLTLFSSLHDKAHSCHPLNSGCLVQYQDPGGLHVHMDEEHFSALHTSFLFLPFLLKIYYLQIQHLSYCKKKFSSKDLLKKITLKNIWWEMESLKEAESLQSEGLSDLFFFLSKYIKALEPQMHPLSGEIFILFIISPHPTSIY